MLAFGVGVSVGLGLAALLAIPLDLRVWLGGEQRPRLQLVWLFGWVRRDLSAPSGPRPPRRRPPVRTWIRVWNEGAGERVIRLARRLRRRVHMGELYLRARYGLGDPADTGLLVGWLCAIHESLGALLPEADVRLEPDFGRTVLEGELRGGVRLVPLGLLPPLVGFACTPVVWRAARDLRRAAR